MQQKIIVEITVDWEDYQDVDPELIFEDTGMPSAAKEGVTYKVITPSSSHQGEVVKDSGIWNEAIEAGRKYQSQVGRLGGDKETCIAVYADGYIDGKLFHPALPTNQGISRTLDPKPKESLMLYTKALNCGSRNMMIAGGCFKT